MATYFTELMEIEEDNRANGKEEIDERNKNDVSKVLQSSTLGEQREQCSEITFRSSNPKRSGLSTT